MDIEKIVLDLRKTRKMKGMYPVLVFIIPNRGGVVSDKKGYFVMTYNQTELYFHGLSRFRHIYKSELDFAIKLNKFDRFTWESLKKSKKFCLISYKNDFLPIGYFSQIRGATKGEANMAYIITELEKRGIHEVSDKEEDIKNGKANQK